MPPAIAQSSAPSATAATEIEGFNEAMQSIINARPKDSVATAAAINQLIRHSELPAAIRFRFTNHVMSRVETTMGTDVSDLLRDPGPPGKRFPVATTLIYRANEDVATFACSAEQATGCMCARHRTTRSPTPTP